MCDRLTIISVEGGPRSGKGLMNTYLGAEAYLAGLRVVSNYTVEFPQVSAAFFDELVSVFPLVKQRGLKAPVKAAITEIVDPRTFDDVWQEEDCLHVRHEFHTEVESRGGLGSKFRLACLDWAAQIGKAKSSLSFDTQDLDSIDKRIRVGEVVQRIWALRPFHTRGEPFEYLVYDRSTMQAEQLGADEEALEFLYSCYDTLERASRLKVPVR